MRTNVELLVNGLLKFILMISQKELLKELIILRDKIIEMEENKPLSNPKLYHISHGTVVYVDGYDWFEVPVGVFNELINHPKLKESF